MNLPIIGRYTRWLHTKFPSGVPERLPETNPDGSTRVRGLYVVGDLQGVPLLKFSADSGARAVEAITASPWFQKARTGAASDAPDLLIIGAGVAGISAALRARRLGLTFQVVESSQSFSTIFNFPKGKPIYTYPKEFEPDTELSTTGETREALHHELLGQLDAAGIQVEEGISITSVRRAGELLVAERSDGSETKVRAVIVAIGRSGNFRRLGVPGEDLDKVSNRLHDPKEYASRQVLVVGGGDSALETAIAVAEAGGAVTLSYRRAEFSRAKPDNVEALERLRVEAPQAGRIFPVLSSTVKEIRADQVTLHTAGAERALPNDYVFAMLGREAPLEFFRKSGVPIQGEWRALAVLSFALFMVFCFWLFLWKAGAGPVAMLFYERSWFPFNLHAAFAAATGALGEALADPATLLGTLAISLQGPGFYYTLAYSLCVVVFGWRRIRRRRTPYVTVQTTTLAVVQVLPLFLLPEIILPLLGHNGWFEGGALRTIVDNLFPAVEYGHGREYWRAYGFILAWPLFIYNVFTSTPLWWWLWISIGQTFVLIPAMIYYFGKGAYCGWICSCGALAETLGDTHRHKMPHGPFWNRLNMTGQVILWAALALLAVRVHGWIAIAGATNEDGTINEEAQAQLPWTATSFDYLIDGRRGEWKYLATDGTEVPEDSVQWESEVVDGEEVWTGFTSGSDGTRVVVEERYTEHINYFTYKWVVDVMLAGIIGVGFYFWYSGRVWCRFACPLAALMHIYTRFSRFRILADKKKCISCNACTTVCHQGIDVMNFANKGLPMEDPQCVRCSACVWTCPTGVLQFGQVDSAGNTICTDRFAASPVLMREGGAPRDGA